MTRLEYSYDIECLKNLFTATFINTADKDDIHVFYIGLGKEDYSDLLKFLSNKMTLIGYNNRSYDDPMLRFIMNYKNKDGITSALYDLSSKLVNDSYRDDKEIRALRYPRNKMYSWDSIDLMRMLGFDRIGVSLKQVSINLRWHKIQDMPISHTSSVDLSQLDLILSYNMNDVEITQRLYEEVLPLVELRRELSKLYHVNLLSESDSGMANKILEKIYSEKLGADMNSIRDMRTVRDKVYLGDCVAKFVEFKTPQLNEALDKVSSKYVYKYNGYKYSDALYFANCEFQLGIGGLHSVDSAGKFETDENYIIRDMDVASYYPNLIINNKFYPHHLGENFIEILKDITAERLKAKREGDKVKAYGLKITVNSIFGKLGSETFWLLDAKQMLSTTVSGQMGLLMLIEELFLNGIEILSSNTDGIVCKIPREKEDLYYQISKAWEEKTGLELEFTTYKKYVRRDVNSYITEKLDPKDEYDKYKEKGAFVQEVDLKRGFIMPIVPKAIFDYFMHGVPIRDTLEKCTDILDFCISQKTGDKYVMELHTMNGIEPLQKTNRFFVSKKGGALMKREYFSKKSIGLYVGKKITILNDYDASVPIEEYAVDIPFYEKEAMKIIDAIEPKQMSLFDVSETRGSIVKMATPNMKKLSQKEEPMMIQELNKLGKNQLLKKLEVISRTKETIKKLNPRYTYVVYFNSKYMTAELYCLGRGSTEQVRVDKRSYNKNPFSTGQLLYCDKFKKSGREYILTEYTISDKFKEDVPELTLN